MQLFFPSFHMACDPTHPEHKGVSTQREVNPRCPLTSSKPRHQCHQKTTHVQLIRCKLVWLCMIRAFLSLQWLKIFAFVGQITRILVFFCLFDSSHLYIIFSTNKSYIICLMLSCRCLTVLILVAGTSMPFSNSTSLPVYGCSATFRRWSSQNMVSKKPGFLFVFQCHKISEISPRRCFDIEGPR